MHLLRSADFAGDSGRLGTQVACVTNQLDRLRAARLGSAQVLSKAGRKVGHSRGSPRPEQAADHARGRPFAAGQSFERAPLPLAGARAFATSRTRTAVSRTDGASRASPRSRAHGPNGARWHRGGSPCNRNRHRPCRCAATSGSAAGAADPDVARLDRPRLLPGRVLRA